MQDERAYEELIGRWREAAILGSCSALLGWDEQTYMPKGGVEHRSRQMSLLAGMHHERVTHPRIGELLDTLEGAAPALEPTSPAAVNVREIRRIYRRAARLPRELVEELAKTISLAQQEWVTARQRCEYARFQPWLETLVSLKRREAECVGFDENPYDALLDEYEPGAKSETLARLFDALRRDLVPLVSAIAGSARMPNTAALRGDFSVDRQRIFGETVAAAVGFDFDRGRLDTTAHPFCSGIGPGDCRITTRFHTESFGDALFGILHEVGHGLYDQGLDPDHYGTPMGEAVSLGIHESQSRLWENAVGRSLPFWQHFFPMARRIFREAFSEVSLDDFHFAVNEVKPSLNRVRADEVTYNLHILVRFELEQALLNGELNASDLPGAWREKYGRYLGVTPEDDAEGCLQDIHWSAGLFGYFPTYTLGNVFAAQFYAQAKAELGDVTAAFARGEFAELLEWLREKIHRQGQRYHSSRLIEQVTGGPIDHGPLVQSLRSKYRALYDV